MPSYEYQLEWDYMESNDLPKLSILSNNQIEPTPIPKSSLEKLDPIQEVTERNCTESMIAIEKINSSKV